LRLDVVADLVRVFDAGILANVYVAVVADAVRETCRRTGEARGLRREEEGAET
jgi:hypothetical protein